MRTSISVSASRPEAFIDAAVMFASRSRTGVSLVCSAIWVLLSYELVVEVVLVLLLEQLTCEAVDWAVETRLSADCVTSLTAVCTEASLGTFLTAAVKLFQALSRSPEGAFCMA